MDLVRVLSPYVAFICLLLDVDSVDSFPFLHRTITI